MLDALVDIAKRVQKLDEDKLVKRALQDKELQSEVLRLNTQEQLYDKGVGFDGQSLGQYAPITVNYYKPLAAQQGRDGRTDHITLRDSGTFYNSFKFINNDKSFDIYAQAVRGETDLEKMFPNALGLTDENLSYLASDLRGTLVTDVLKEIQG